MKIVHISFSDTQGGASIAALRLNEAMKKAGLDSHLLVLNHTAKNDISIISPHKRNAFFSKIYRVAEYRILKYFYGLKNFSFSLAAYGMSLSKLEILKDADFIILHWVNSGTLSINGISKILNLQIPVYWFLHDMWPLTGGCHYSFDCSNYENFCGECFLLNQRTKKDLSYQVFLKKRQLTNFSNLTLVAPSKWMADCASRSSLFKNNEVIVIPNTIDTGLFKPCDQSLARERLGLPLNRKLLLFGAVAGSQNPYKGWSFFIDSLKELDDVDFDIAVFGNSSGGEELTKELNRKIYFLGSISNPETMVDVYNSVNVFISPSLAESFGQTIVEAMACNTLVVAFSVGGITDIVQHKFNGYLARYKDSSDLAIGIHWALNTANDLIQQQGRKYVIDNYSYPVIVEKYINLFRNGQSK